ncbi:carbamoyltransferase HypF [Streptomyces sp. CBMA152]|uniref:carbamoyltransferase HypF n=1 Tax=Streptomyces sp. CBMA152 TaxID=1896312 RepID=UPI0016602C57|nr:carbamoyltransferase HypF [Streptomyces sp. CBMA152]MBD0741345.1 carbamoyltransferase HypF [Streptomyces sp. CBMA152]
MGEREGRNARRFCVYGTVQVVGFWPFVHRTAVGLRLDGWVADVNGHVEGLVVGSPLAIGQFAARLREEAPGPARVRRVSLDPARGRPPAAGAGFTVRADSGARRARAAREVPPDAAICDACLRELGDPGDRRHRYPFITCTRCGPRATIIEELPYDRILTTMRHFPPCRACAAEYADPGGRRFRAEPIACADCGPRLAWQSLTGEAALRAAVAAVADGKIVAVKGVGGYQLVCDAADERAVAELRRRKHRPAKPFAVMAADLADACRIATISKTARTALTSPVRPVVLLPRLGQGIAPSVAPDTDRLGVLLPTTGLHRLLLQESARPLVVTSGNVTDGPLAIDDATARRELAEIADGFLVHDRPIRARYDDSVVQPTGRAVRTVRRARGLAPAPLPLPVHTPVPLVAAGARIEHTFTLAEHGHAHLSPHSGDLSSAAALQAFETAYTDLTRLTGITPHAVAHDLNPRCLSTVWATDRPLERIPVQHHHAHAAACAAEHGVRGPFTAVTYDGLGLGDDGTLWGGEILVADLTVYRRVARFATAPLPGGEAAVRHPARMALGYLHGVEALGAPAPDARLTRRFTGRLDPREAEVVRAMIGRDPHAPRTSSAGRLFDAVASLLGLCDRASYHGEAAVALENAAGTARAQPLAVRVVRVGSLWVYDPVPTLTDLLERAADGEPLPRLAAAFHLAVACATADLVGRAVAEGAPRTVCLGGGCFVNRRLLAEVRRRLCAEGLRVLVPADVPCGDGGISFGQAVVAAARLARRKG